MEHNLKENLLTKKMKTPKKVWSLIKMYACPILCIQIITVALRPCSLMLVDLRNMYIFKHYFSKVITNSWFICNFFNFDFFFQVKYIFFKVFTNEYVLCSIKINLCFDYLLGVIPLNNFPYHFMLNKQKLSFYTGFTWSKNISDTHISWKRYLIGNLPPKINI